MATIRDLAIAPPRLVCLHGVVLGTRDYLILFVLGKFVNELFDNRSISCFPFQRMFAFKWAGYMSS
jgi:hypothetical protein